MSSFVNNFGRNKKNRRCKGRNFRKIKKSATTLDVSIVTQPNPTRGTIGSFFKLQYGPGYRLIVRQELAKAKRGRKRRRIPLASFVQITDVHIIDAASPARAAFLAQYIPERPDLADSFRPQEALTLQVEEAMVRKINAVKVGPHTGCPISFVISTGDNGDGQQQNELQNYINVLDGTKVFPNPATPGRYVGVQDTTPTVNYAAYYHPDDTGRPDIYKVEYGFPSFNNLLNVAAKPFCTTGLDYPWYTANGNHDCTKLGNYGLNLWSMLELFDQIAAGEIPDGVGSKLIQAMNPRLAQLFVAALEVQSPEGVLEVLEQSVLRNIPRSAKRIQYTRDDFIAMHFNTTTKPGPVGHGFTQENRDLSTLYYQLEISDCVSGFVLDTCNPSGNLVDPMKAPNGSIGRRQWSWLESKLIKRHSSYLNNQNEIVFTKNPDKLCVIFSHHDHNTMDNIFHALDAVDPDPQKIDGLEFIRNIQRFPNVILWVNGHTHRNIVTPLRNVNCPINIQCPRKCSSRKSDSSLSKSSSSKYHSKKKFKYTGFWEINTASHIDYPQNSRVIEIADNRDGTLSIFGTLIDHLSPPCVEAKGPKYSLIEMASISRELSINDPFNDPKTRVGLPKDRNVELLINNPLLRDW